MKYLLLNHKMNLLASDITSYIENLPKKEKLIVFPSSLYIPYFLGKGLEIGCQDISSQEMGALTSEISAKQYKSLGVKYALIGHSERRKNYPNEAEKIADKMKRAEENGLTPVLCIGEEAGTNKEEQLKRELQEALTGLTDITNVWIAYEPLSNIGSGEAMAKEEIDNTITWIRNYMQDTYKCTPTILYGGSVNDINMPELITCDADGFLVGNAGLDPKKVVAMIKEME